VPAPRDVAELVRAARLYYEQGLSQQAVAERLGTSRSNVSRMLSAALAQGVVEIRIHDLSGRSEELEQRLRTGFGLREVRVTDRPRLSERADPLLGVASLAAQLFLEVLDDGVTVAVSWGRTLQEVASATQPERTYDATLVQLAGGLSALATEVSGAELVRELAGRTGASFELLHAPVAFETREARDALLGEPMITAALDAAADADVALVGIGSPTHGSSAALVGSLGLDPDEERAFWAARPVGDVAARYYDIDGRAIRGAAEDRVLAVSLEALAAIPFCVGVAAGRQKARAVLGALRGGLLDGLVCDSDLALAVLAESGATAGTTTGGTRSAGESALESAAPGPPRVPVPSQLAPTRAPSQVTRDEEVSA
jgi:DNA-binding transcriptional regulator LsrR (DeoR family)